VSRFKKKYKKLSDVPPSARRSFIFSNEVSNGFAPEAMQGQVANIVDLIVSEYQSTRVDLGTAVILDISVTNATVLLKLLFSIAYPTFSFNSFEVGGYEEVSDGSPWVLDVRGNGKVHNDIYGQHTRTIPGRHFDCFTLLFVVKTKGEYKFNVWSKMNCAIEQQHEVFTLKTGDWVVFPARLQDSITADRDNTRRIVSVQFKKK
jgi:hypothetical protein